MKLLTRLLLICICAALAFGGTFTCEGSSHSDHTSNPPPAK